MATQTLITAEQFDRLPHEEGRKYELLDGELIEVSSATGKHNQIVANLVASLLPFLRRTHLGTTIPDTEFAFAGHTRLRPDVAVLLGAKLAETDLEKISIPVPPDIAAEIVSPSESARQLDRKIQVHREAGVSEVWVIYPELQHLFVYGCGSLRELRESATLESPLLPGWSIAVKDLFKV